MGESARRLAGGRGSEGAAEETERLPDAAVEGLAISLARPRWRWGQVNARSPAIAPLPVGDRTSLGHPGGVPKPARHAHTVAAGDRTVEE
jgi:hypothetical protein